MTKLRGQPGTRFAVDFFHPLFRTDTFPLCCLTEPTNVISSGKLQRLFSSQPFPLSESSPLRSLQQSAPNPQILSLPAGRAETLPVPSPSPPTTLIHQIPWPCSPPPARQQQSWHQMSTDKGRAKHQKAIAHHPCPDGAPGKTRVQSPTTRAASEHPSATVTPGTRSGHFPHRGHGDKTQPTSEPTEGLQSPSCGRDLNQGSLMENKRDFI